MADSPVAHGSHTRLKDAGIMLGLLAAAAGLCWLLQLLGGSENAYNSYVSMIFILAVFLTARFTNGYVWGIFSSLFSVLAVNYIFTYPYLAFNFTLAGYPIAILSMLAVSLTTSALTSQTKRGERIRIEAEKEKTRSNLLRAVSHDLRTPLTAIAGATATVMENQDTLSAEEKAVLLKGVQENAQWLIRMVENLLAVTRLDEDGAAHIVKQPEAAEEIVSGAVMNFKKRFPAQPVTVKVPEEPLFVPMDAVLIEQVLLNLLENAVLHGKTVQTLMLSVRQENERAVFEVCDDGVGFDTDTLIAVRTGRAVGTDNDRKRSMGIGLSVCGTIVRAHGGELTAGNGVTGGAVMRVFLPLEEMV